MNSVYRLRVELSGVAGFVSGSFVVQCLSLSRSTLLGHLCWTLETRNGQWDGLADSRLYAMAIAVESLMC